MAAYPTLKEAAAAVEATAVESDVMAATLPLRQDVQMGRVRHGR
jgi:hypothetical protein